MSARFLALLLPLIAIALASCASQERYQVLDNITYEQTLIEVRQRSLPIVTKHLAGEELTDEEMEEISDVMQMMEAAIRYDPVRYVNHIQMAKLRQVAGENEAAMRSYDQAYRLIPREHASEADRSALYTVLVERGALAARMLLYTQAYEDYLAAFELMPFDQVSGYNAASIAVELGETEEAVRILHKVLEVHPDDEDAQQLLDILTTTA